MAAVFEALLAAVAQYSGESIVSILILAGIAYHEYVQKKYWQDKYIDAEDERLTEKEKRIEEMDRIIDAWEKSHELENRS